MVKSFPLIVESDHLNSLVAAIQARFPGLTLDQAHDAARLWKEEAEAPGANPANFYESAEGRRRKIYYNPVASAVSKVLED